MSASEKPLKNRGPAPQTSLRPKIRLIPTPVQLRSIAAYTSQMARQARLYLEVVGEPNPGAQPPRHLKNLGLPSLAATVQKLEQILSKDSTAAEGVYLDTTVALEWLAEVLYGLLERWGWSGDWEWREDRSSKVPYLALPIAWEVRTVHAEELAAMEKIAALLAVPPWGIPPEARGVPTNGAAQGGRPVVKEPPALLTLYGVYDGPVVRGRVKPPLSLGQYDVLVALVKSGPAGLSKRELGELSGHPTSAVKILRSVAALGPDWASVIVFPEKIGRGGYRIADR